MVMVQPPPPLRRLLGQDEPPEVTVGWRRNHLEIESSFHSSSGVSQNAGLHHYACLCSRIMTTGGSYQNVERAAAYLLFKLLFICNLLLV